MRSTLDIIIAVKESQPATEQELRLALLAITHMDHLIRQDLEKLIDAVLSDNPSCSPMRARFAEGTLRRMFLDRKQPPDKWLGPNHTPGTPEYELYRAWGKRLIENDEALAREMQRRAKEQAKPSPKNDPGPG